MRVYIPLAVLIIGGCASSRPPAALIDSENIVYEIGSVMDSIWAHTLPASLRAEGNLSMKTPLYSGPAMKAEISHRKGDSLLIVFRLFGVEGGKLLVTGDSLFFYDRLTKTLHTGESSHSALPPVLRVDRAMEQMLGFVHPASQAGLQLKSTRDGLTLEDSRLRRTYVIDPEYWRIVHVTQKDASGNLVEAFHYSNFFSVGEFHVPRQVIYRNSAQNTSVILTYRSVSVNESVTPMSLHLPSDVKRVPLPEE